MYARRSIGNKEDPRFERCLDTHSSYMRSPDFRLIVSDVSSAADNSLDESYNSHGLATHFSRHGRIQILNYLSLLILFKLLMITWRVKWYLHELILSFEPRVLVAFCPDWFHMGCKVLCKGQNAIVLEKPLFCIGDRDILRIHTQAFDIRSLKAMIMA